MKNTAQEIFENRLDILIFAVYSDVFSVADIFEAVLDTSRMTIRNCLKDLVKSGYLEKLTMYSFQATYKAKQLFGVTA